MNESVLNSSPSVFSSLKKLRSIWLLIALIPLFVSLLDNERLPEILGIAAGAFTGTLPYIAVAVLLIAWLKASGAEAVVGRAFEGRETNMIVFAALLGGLAPFCSCEVIPFIAGLLAVGAPLSAVMAFWLSSPLIDPPSLFITAGALGYEFAIGKAIAAVFIGLLGGFGIKFLVRAGAFSGPLKSRQSGGCCGCGSPFRGKPNWRFWQESKRLQTFRSEGWQNGVFLVKWLMFAYMLEALMITYIPAQAIASVVGGEGLKPIVIGAFVGAPAYLNSYAAPALVAGLIEQGMSVGAGMAFMVAGAVSSIPAMAAVWSLVRWPVFAAYMGFGVLGAVISGIVFAAYI